MALDSTSAKEIDLIIPAHPWQSKYKQTHTQHNQGDLSLIGLPCLNVVLRHCKSISVISWR